MLAFYLTQRSETKAPMAISIIGRLISSEVGKVK